MSTGRSCNALWTFERMVDKELRSNVRDTIREVTIREVRIYASEQISKQFVNYFVDLSKYVDYMCI